MRNYWLKILLGAFAIFAVGMIGVTVARRGIDRVHSVVASSDPITVPLGMVPFVLGGERLGQLNRVTLIRETPRRVSSVELEVTLADSLVARGLEGCRLAANIEGNRKEPGVNVQVGREKDAFRCVPADSQPADLVEYGTARLQPGDIHVPLLLQRELVDELQQFALAHDSTAEEAEEQAESLAEFAELNEDSIMAIVRRADSLSGKARRIGDSLRAAALRRADSIEAASDRMADSLNHR